jgi:hypothetical protein
MRILFALLRMSPLYLLLLCLYVVYACACLVPECDVRHYLTFPQFGREMLTILTFDYFHFIPLPFCLNS